MDDELDILNRFMVAKQGDNLRVMLPVVATPDQALAHAAWLVAMAEPFASHDFAEYLKAVQAT